METQLATCFGSGTKEGFGYALAAGADARAHAQLRVADPGRFQQLADELKIVNPYLESYGCAHIKPVLHPQLALTGTLGEAVYGEAWADATQRRFETSFEVSTLVLLRRQHEFATCKQVNLFGLQP